MTDDGYDLDDLIEEACQLAGARCNDQLAKIVTSVIMELIYLAPELELRQITDDIMRDRAPSAQGDLFPLSAHECCHFADYLRKFAEQDFLLRDQCIEYMALQAEGLRQKTLKEYGPLAVARAKAEARRRREA